MICTFCGSFPQANNGSTCKVCRTCNRLVSSLKLYQFHPSQEGALLAVLRSTIGTVSDLADEASSVALPPVAPGADPKNFGFPAEEHQAGNPGGEGSGLAAPAPPVEAKEEVEKEVDKTIEEKRRLDKEAKEEKYSESEEESESEYETEEEIEVEEPGPEDRRKLKAEKAPEEERHRRETRSRRADSTRVEASENWEKVEIDNPGEFGLHRLQDKPRRNNEGGHKRPRSPSGPPPTGRDRTRAEHHRGRDHRPKGKGDGKGKKKRKKNRGKKKRERGQRWREEKRREAQEERWRQREREEERRRRPDRRERRGWGQLQWG